MICWFDDVLLILIHGFAWFRVDLASPQVSPSFIHEISSILTPKSPNSAQNHVPNLGSRVDPDTPDDHYFTGRPEPQEPPDVRSRRNHRTSDLTGRPEPPNPSRISGFLTRPDVRPPDIRFFWTSATCRYQLQLIFVSAITNSSEVRFSRSLAC